MIYRMSIGTSSFPIESQLPGFAEDDFYTDVLTFLIMRNLLEMGNPFDGWCSIMFYLSFFGGVITSSVSQFNVNQWGWVKTFENTL